MMNIADEMIHEKQNGVDIKRKNQQHEVNKNTITFRSSIRKVYVFVKLVIGFDIGVKADVSPTINEHKHIYLYLHQPFSHEM